MMWKDSKTDIATRPVQNFLLSKVANLTSWSPYKFLEVPGGKWSPSKSPTLPFYLWECVRKQCMLCFLFEERIPLCFKCLKTNDLDFLKNKDGINGEKINFFLRRGIEHREGQGGKSLRLFFGMMVVLGKGDKNEKGKTQGI